MNSASWKVASSVASLSLSALNGFCSLCAWTMERADERAMRPTSPNVKVRAMNVVLDEEKLFAGRSKRGERGVMSERER